MLTVNVVLTIRVRAIAIGLATIVQRVRNFKIKINVDLFNVCANFLNITKDFANFISHTWIPQRETWMLHLEN